MAETRRKTFDSRKYQAYVQIKHKQKSLFFQPSSMPP